MIHLIVTTNIKTQCKKIKTQSAQLFRLSLLISLCFFLFVFTILIPKFHTQLIVNKADCKAKYGTDYHG